VVERVKPRRRDIEGRVVRRLSDRIVNARLDQALENLDGDDAVSGCSDAIGADVQDGEGTRALCLSELGESSAASPCP
jgi:hypothetical protein